MITIYHNPRCSKSRQALALLEERALSPAVVKYLETPLDKQALKDLLTKLQVNVRDIIRTSEKPYKENQLNDIALSDDQLLDAIATYPELLQRPIVVKDDQAIIGRPPENVLTLIK